MYSLVESENETEASYSNACKFTPSGGKLTIRTKLVLPYIAPGGDPLNPPQSLPEDGQDDKPRYPLSVSHLSRHDTEQELEEVDNEKTNSKSNSHPSASKSDAPSEIIVVRIEVEDTGYGIKPCDMHKLFSKLCLLSGSRVNSDCNFLAAFNQTEQGRQQGKPCRMSDTNLSTILENRWKRDWSGPGACATNCQAERGKIGGAIQSWTGVNVLGRASSRNRTRSCREPAASPRC